MTTFQTVANEFYRCFTSHMRGDTRITVLTDDAPSWCRDAVYKAHDGRLPDDWIYESCQSIACSIADYDDPDSARDASGEIADSNVDIYNHARLQWLAAGWADETDEANSDAGTPGDASIIERIGIGQYVVLDTICHRLIEAIETEAETRERMWDGFRGCSKGMVSRSVQP